MSPDAGNVEREEAAIGELLAELTAADSDLVEPPAAVWKGIEAAVGEADATPRPTGHRLRHPRAAALSAGTVVEYSIDADDVVVRFGEGWVEFAGDNGAPDLASPTFASPTSTSPTSTSPTSTSPAGRRTLWTYIDDPDLRELWRFLVGRVRHAQTEVRLPLRCDAPQAKRWFEVTITPHTDGAVDFRSLMVFEEARPAVALLDWRSDREHDAEPVPVCSWCGSARHGDRWLDIEEVVRVRRLLERSAMPPLAYGLCGNCREEMQAELLVPRGAA